MIRRRAGRGFTLIEMMIVVAIIGILAALASAAVIYGQGRARLNNLTYEIAAMSTVAQLRAQSTGRPYYVIFYEKGDERGIVMMERDERTGVAAPPAWSAVDPTVEASSGGRYVDRIRFAGNSSFERGTTKYADVTKFGAKLPDPFAAVSLAASGSGGLLKACTFCVAGGGGTNLGAIRYAPDGTIQMATGASIAGGAIALDSQAQNEGSVGRLIAFAAPAGAVKVLRR